MLIFQFSIAFFFLVGGLVMALQIRFLENKDLGFQSGDLVQIKLFNQQNRRKFYENAENIEKIKHITGVEGAALSSISFRNKIEPRVDVSVEQRSFGADAVGVTDDYLRLLKFKMTAISIQDSTPQVVVNKRFVSESGITDILGKEVSIGGRCYLVRAVVEDFLKAGFGELPEPLVLFSLTEHSFLPYHIEWVTLKVKPENRQATLALLENFWKANIDSEYPFQAVPLADLYAENYESFAKQRNMFWVFNLAVVFISLFGLFALVSFDVERRLKEMAVRKVLGASNLSLLRQLGFRFIMYAGVGALLAIYPSHLIMTAWLANFKYHIPWSIAPFAFAFVTLFILTFCVVLFRVYQVTRMDLLKFLKYE